MEATEIPVMSKHICMALEQIGLYPASLIDYINLEPSLRSFYTYHPSEKAHWEKVIQAKTFSSENRKVLVDSLLSQYQNELNEAVKGQINSLLLPNTYTVTTGHQLVINTGPLYFILKIAGTIALARQLKEWFPESNFVPVYWMASEDHDRDEINHFYLFGKKVEWTTTQTGAVGKFQTEGLAELISQVNGIPELFIQASSQSCLAEALRFLVDGLFGEYGLVVMDADRAELKNLFKPVLKKELFEQFALPALAETTAKLEKEGYNSQIMGREINLFYLQEGSRERIEKQGDGYVVNRTELKFTVAEIEEELENHPERFSPNVVLRPVYQETILPNVAYIGGPAEVAYWLQLTGVFEKTRVNFPMLVPRTFGMVVPAPQHQRLTELGLGLDELLLSSAELKELMLAKEAVEAIDFNPTNSGIEEAFNALTLLAEQWDKTLVATVQAELSKTQKGVENLEKRIQKAMESRFSNKANQALAIQQKLFPEGGLQERHSNILNFIIGDSSLISDMVKTIDPLSFTYNIWYR